MNKKYQRFVPFCILLGLVLFCVVLVLFCKSKIEEYGEVNIQVEKVRKEKIQKEEQIKKEEELKRDEEMKLRNLKEIYKSQVPSSSDNLGMFGTMFNDIINVARSNGLYIRSIEYNMRPNNDPIYNENPENYNVCELKFFFVGTYSQMLSFLEDMDKNFPNFTSISSLSISAFQENPDYLLINESITLYSEKYVPSNKGRK